MIVRDHREPLIIDFNGIDLWGLSRFGKITTITCRATKLNEYEVASGLAEALAKKHNWLDDYRIYTVPFPGGYKYISVFIPRIIIKESALQAIDKYPLADITY